MVLEADCGRWASLATDEKPCKGRISWVVVGHTGAVGEVPGSEVLAPGRKVLLIGMFCVMRAETGPWLCAQCVPKPLALAVPADMWLGVAPFAVPGQVLPLRGR